ncbi:MAG TPA: hypothetical protein VFO10_26640 [Oligoflexus sp.]|uniref:hypothetical protein n=1 Tax=Oligoflexus sp. TaxID=1971216 RepID=UPI002D7E943C|nr:hypothetical protein [Oligoflexus sp.]HET9240871.1 hypothetical protein [Oligoflexus sp.]
MNLEVITQKCHISNRLPRSGSWDVNRRSLLLGAAASPLLFIAGRSRAEQLTLNADDVKDYAQESISNITASNVGAIPEYDVNDVYGNVADVFNDHTSYDSGSDQTYADDLLSHYINQGRQTYRPYEQQFDQAWTGGLNREYYRRKFARRAFHLSECFICGGFIRSQCAGTDIRLIIFDPGYAIFEGSRYPVENGFIIIDGSREPLTYNTDSYYWYFGDNQRLYW